MRRVIYRDLTQDSDIEADKSVIITSTADKLDSSRSMFTFDGETNGQTSIHVK